ncbi:hypothetical protein EW146_g1739 [Bondarzewia mesenterica]|uniref:Helicase ATP-binding domain-containing protein n=1 Tax=Bondarzewia mesenterica TaxID=1095465 RepID=A0A4S4M908_9AGAM|nr:hypothetical protein EW146_g1739 [Bondarzewia mesenterica]
MEEMRHRLLQDTQPQPVNVDRKPMRGEAPQSAIVAVSVSSSSTDQSQSDVVEILDSDDDEPEILVPQDRTVPANVPPRPQIERIFKNKDMPQRAPAQPIPIPYNRNIPALTHAKLIPGNSHWETFEDVNVDSLYDPKKSTQEAEKDLKDFLQQSFDGRDDGQDGDEIDMSETIVEGFRDGITLLPHQVIGRRWMRERESAKKLGGILADDMGLGKTIQTLTRVVEGRPRRADKEDGWAAGTLVVCPVSLVSQWASEVRKMVNGLTVIEHHGPSRTTNPDQLKKAHVVITSYAIVASEYGAYSPHAKDEGAKNKTKKKASSPNSDNDESDSERFGRTLAAKKKPIGSKKKDALFHVNWWRIVLDEAHNIKNRNTLNAKACFALEGKYRWCLTGTPLQNNVEELYSLLAFLRIRPLNDWATFSEQISKPIKSGKTARPMKRLQVVLKSIMLRRKKTDLLNGRPLLELPERHLNIIPCEFDEEERQFYTGLEGRIEAAMSDIVKSGALNKNYTSVLVLLLRLRQACDHPSLVSQDYKKDKEAVQPQESKKNDNDSDSDADELADMLGQLGLGRACQVCQTSLSKDNVSPELEDYCQDCAQIAKNARRKSMARGDSSHLPPDSAKIRKTLELLEEIADRKDEDGDYLGEKTIVFSQFTSMLDLLEVFLKDAGIKYVRYDGSMSKDKREASLEKIRTSRSTTVILISFKAGSTGLNLTACNNDQAFDRAHRYGQKRDVNIYKLTIEKTVEERILTLQNTKRALADAALSGDKIKNSKLGMDDLLALFRPGRDDEED